MQTDFLPESLASEAQRAWQRILERADETTTQDLIELAAHGEHAGEIARVLACSPFVVEQSLRRPALLLDLLAGGDLARSFVENECLTSLQAALAAEPDLDTTLRRFRQRQMLRIVWRDFTRRADTGETTRDTSLLAEACLQVAQNTLHAELVQRHGQPIGRHSGEPQELIVIAMGKLGARELNLSSDIDLIFAYPESGQTDGDKCITNEEFFIKLGQRLIASLDRVNAEGFVFRVDMRLRPYGDSGALVHNFTALEEYYQDQGRDWERYAMIKARPVTGQPRYARELIEDLRPFVYRRYVDFGVIESLRGMKQMINAEVRRRGLDNNVKLGHGGIREVEFIAQCFQLIRGGRDFGLQQRELLPVLEECVNLACLPQAAAAELREAYLFLRDSEHAIQGYMDRQTQELPVDPLPQAAMAQVMGRADWEAYLGELAAQRQRVSAHFDALIAAPEEESESDAPDLLLWGEQLDAPILEELGFQDPDTALAQLQELQQSRRITVLQAAGRERLEAFMPQLIRACAEVEDPDLALARLLPLVSAVARRSAYLALLLENPQALDELVALCHASPWIAEQMTARPVLLDELLDRASLYTAPDKEALLSELREFTARIPMDDLEAQMDALRYFQAAHVLRVAASEITGRLPLKQVSDKLTYIAEVLLEQCIAVAWADLTAKYGEPAKDSPGTGFTVLGYGKLGGIELGYGSDLDLVFVFDAKRQGVTSGPRSIDNTVFYTRLGQLVIHILETRMSLGQLYEVDLRLRPSGESGMLVPSLSGFDNYQRDSAWTWEHQALVRARHVAGDVTVAEAAEAVRRETLCRERDEASLAAEVVKMRRKMRDHLLPREDRQNGEFHLKQGGGGIVDIEFMVQYAVLAWSHRVPALARWSDNVRILETLGQEGLFEQSECELLTEAYLAYRSAAHQLSLQQNPGVVPAGRFDDYRGAVEAKWQQLFAGVNPQAEGEE